MFELDVLLVGYFCGWIIASAGLYVAGRRFAEADAAAPHPLGVSIAGGALWPLLLVGLLETTSVVVCTKRHLRPEPRRRAAQWSA